MTTHFKICWGVNKYPLYGNPLLPGTFIFQTGKSFTHIGSYLMPKKGQVCYNWKDGLKYSLWVEWRRRNGLVWSAKQGRPIFRRAWLQRVLEKDSLSDSLIRKNTEIPPDIISASQFCESVFLRYCCCKNARYHIIADYSFIGMFKW